jgi:hypothetical protein
MNEYELKKKLEKLNKNIFESNKNKSSHWVNHLGNIDDILDINKNHGFGSYEKKSYKEYLYFFLRRMVFGNKIFKTKLYKKLKIIFDKVNRAIDADTIRHIFTFDSISKYIEPKSICIIGDGKLNGVLCSHLMFPEAKIYSINLSEILMHDLVILNKTNLKIKKEVTLIENVNQEDNSKLNLIPSNFKNYLLNKKIDLFVNIASFQEMRKSEIADYFKIIKNNHATLYCCNRDYKKLVGGEEIYFNEYPFNDSERIFWESCIWHKKYYSLRYPFIRKFKADILHCLVKFSNKTN